MKKSMEHLMDKKSKMPEQEKSAKMSVLHSMKKMAEDQMSGKLDGMKKVSVMSNSPEGLEKGLSKAKQIVSSDPLEGQEPNELEQEVAPTHDEHNAMPMDAEMPPGGEEQGEDKPEEEMTPEELDEKIQHLLALKQIKEGK